MRRSGHHALINWASPVCGYPFHINEVRKYPPSLRFSPNWLEKLTKAIEARCIAYNYEDFEVLDIQTIQKRIHELESKKKKKHKRTTHKHILCLRDPLNCFSSRLNHKGIKTRPSSTPKRMADLWKQHAHIALDRNQTLIDIDVVINYNMWVTEKEYRIELAEQLGGEFTDKNKDRVCNFGGGSTFQGAKVSAKRLNIFDRWRHCLDNPLYLEAFDEEVFDFTRQLFPQLEGFDEVYRLWKWRR